MTPSIRMIAKACWSLGVLAMVACAPRGIGNQDGSQLDGYSQSQLRGNVDGTFRKAEEAVCLLENNGWANIPEKTLPRGWSHGDLMRQMACIANKESTFGQATTGPWTGSCGNAFGYWQIAECHKGRSYGGYRCPARSNSELRDNHNVSAQCALYVYMERALSGYSGLGPWEATCSASERNAIRADGQPLFPSGCGSASCQSKFRYEFSSNGQTLSLSTAADCSATEAAITLLQVEGSQSIRSGRDVPPVTLRTEGDRKVAVFDLATLNSSKVFNRVRLMLKNGQRELYRSNPSPNLPPMSDVEIPAERPGRPTDDGSIAGGEPTRRPAPNRPDDQDRVPIPPADDFGTIISGQGEPSTASDSDTQESRVKDDPDYRWWEKRDRR